MYFNQLNKRKVDSNELFSRFEQKKVLENSDCYVMMKSPLEKSNEELRFNYEQITPKKTGIDTAFIPKSNDRKMYPQKFGDRVVLRSSKMPKKGDKGKQTKKAEKTNTEPTGEFMKNWQHWKYASTGEGSKTIGNVQNGNKVIMKQNLRLTTHPTTGQASKPSPLKIIQTKESYTPVGNYFFMLPNTEFSDSFVGQNDAETSKPDDGLYVNLEHMYAGIKPMRTAPPTPLRRTFSSKDGQRTSKAKINKAFGDRNEMANRYF